MELNENERKLLPRLTPEFLDTLMQAARTYGHSGDYVELAEFVIYVYELAGLGGCTEVVPIPFPDAYPADSVDGSEGSHG